MSHLLAPAARSDRRAGGRHGRPGGRAGTPAAAPIATQLLRLTVLPAAAITLCAWATVLCAVCVAPGDPGAAFWAVLTTAAVLTPAILAAAALAARRTARTLRDRIVELRSSTARRQAELLALVESLRRGAAPPGARTPALPARGSRKDDLGLLAVELSHAHDAAVTAVAQTARLPRRPDPVPQPRGAGTLPMAHVVDVFVNLARRLQSLVHREISILDELENEIEDPELLSCLFRVDHLATRMRRHAENLAVLGGAVARRQWSRPVPVTDVLRSAMAEVEQYTRVRLVPPTDGTVRGHAVADVVHLLAELVENATAFSAPHTSVLLRAATVTSGLALEVEDRGLGMPPHEQARMNMLLSDPARVDVGRLLQDGRIGLYVVSQLARRHGVSVRLQTNIYGGTQAVLVLPKQLLGGEQDEPATVRPALAHPGRTATRPTPLTAAASVTSSGTPGAPGTSGGSGTPDVPGASGAPGPSEAFATDVPPGADGLPGTGDEPGADVLPDAGIPSGAGVASAADPRSQTGSLPVVDVPVVADAQAAVDDTEASDCRHASDGPGRSNATDALARSHATDAVDSLGAAAHAAFGGPTASGGRDGARAGAGVAAGAGASAHARTDGERGDAPAYEHPVDGPAHAKPADGLTHPPADAPLLTPTADQSPAADTPAPAPAADPVPAPRPQPAVPSPRADRTHSAERPRLPRRQAQQHLAPELREGAEEPQADEEFTGHDPDLMAAFQRGFGRGEAAADPAGS